MSNTHSTTCGYCGMRMRASTTPAGESCRECPRCKHVAMIAAPTPTPAATPALNKAEWMINQGVQPTAVRGGWLVPSNSRAGVVHRVSTDLRCSCEAGQAHRGCWHIEAVKLMSMQEAA